MELTRACQKQYELEQELAFYKIDAKFEPLSYFPSEVIILKLWISFLFFLFFSSCFSIAWEIPNFYIYLNDRKSMGL